MIRTVLVDDQDMIRVGLRGILRTRGNIEVIGEAADGIEAVSVVRSTRPDVVLMDIRMPGIDGVEAVQRIRAEKELNPVRILVLTTFENDHNVIRAIKAGAQGFLGKNVGPTELLNAVEHVAAGVLLSPNAAGSLVAHVADSSAPSADEQAEGLLAALTSRERGVVVQVAAGLTNEEIAARLFISPFTVKTHLNRAMAKTGSGDGAQLVVLAYKAGLANSN